MGGPSAEGDGDAGSRSPHAVFSVLVRAHLPHVPWAGWRWATRSYTFKGRDVCALSGPRTEAAVRSLTDPPNDLLHA